MKPVSFFKIVLLILPLLLSSCAAKKTLVNTEKPVKIENIEQQKVLQKVSDNAMYSKFITSKVKFQIEVGAQNMTLTGNLKMKRDDVIRLQLMMFGFVEAGRLEFTKDYVERLYDNLLFYIIVNHFGSVTDFLNFIENDQIKDQNTEEEKCTE